MIHLKISECSIIDSVAFTKSINSRQSSVNSLLSWLRLSDNWTFNFEALLVWFKIKNPLNLLWYMNKTWHKKYSPVSTLKIFLCKNILHTPPQQTSSFVNLPMGYYSIIFEESKAIVKKILSTRIHKKLRFFLFRWKNLFFLLSVSINNYFKYIMHLAGVSYHVY